MYGILNILYVSGKIKISSIKIPIIKQFVSKLLFIKLDTAKYTIITKIDNILYLIRLFFLINGLFTVSDGENNIKIGGEATTVLEGEIMFS